jgi:hypothetical protein
MMQDALTWLARLARSSGSRYFAIDKLGVFGEVVR